MRAYGAAGDALAAGDAGRAVELLAWAKTVAARSVAVREALGIALYLTGEYPAAHSELLAYRRLSGRHDQNHLLADCARAGGRPDRVAEYVTEMERAGAPPDRVVEGLIVLAGSRADGGDVDAALAVLDRAGLDPEHVEPWHPRLWYTAADLYERRGDKDRARDYFEAITSTTDDFLDVDERIAALDR
ncbi:MAG: tetratricopeptide repeat protein [Euzebyaceae bacterium]|jgi:tetratricopeptide (TPR) repeat protein|nr:tetratricopeptide repeat protein [Euzebyaceae bacterium]